MSQTGSYLNPLTTVDTLTGNAGGPIWPTLNNINIVGGGAVTVTGNPATSTLTITLGAAIAGTYTADGATVATPAAGNLNIFGTASQITTAGAGDTVTLSLPSAIIAPGSLTTTTTLTATLGDITATAGNLLLPSTNAAGTEGIIRVNGNQFIHALGISNVFMGTGTGNLTLNTGFVAATTIIGDLAGQAINQGSSNTSVGYGTLQALTNGGTNVAFGSNSLQNILTGSSNIALGANSGNSYTTSESNNIAIGHVGVVADSAKIRIGTTGTHTSTFIAGIASIVVANTNLVTINTVTGELGSQAVPAAAPVTSVAGDSGGALTGAIVIAGGTNITTSGAGVTVTVDLDADISVDTVLFPTTSSTDGIIKINSNRFLHAYGTSNTFIGETSGNFTLTVGNATQNTGIGKNTLLALTIGGSNTAVGYASSTAITTGSNNVSVGYNSLLANQTGINNTAVGYESLKAATSDNNTGCGNDSLLKLTSGVRNTALGTAALPNVLTGTDNVGIGYQAGDNYVGAESGNIVIGLAYGVAGESNKTRIGFNTTNASVQTGCYIDGIDGINVGSVATVVTMASGHLGTATISGGAGISITPGANSISIASTATGFVWTATSVDASLVASNGYIASKAGLLTMTLPAVAAVGAAFRITGVNIAVGWRIAQNAGQTIYFGTSFTTTGATGYIESTAIRDTVELVCVVANNDFNVVSSIGNITIA
jgi:hypothetical protein